jgi:hypothetical protein
MISTVSSTAQAFPVKVASIGSGSDINGCVVISIVLTFAFLEEDGSTVPSLSEKSAFRFVYRRAAAFLPDMAIISRLQISHQWLGFSDRR